MTAKKKLEAKDLSALFGGKQKRKPRRVPGPQKTEDDIKAEASTSTIGQTETTLEKAPVTKKEVPKKTSTRVAKKAAPKKAVVTVAKKSPAPLARPKASVSVTKESTPVTKPEEISIPKVEQTSIILEEEIVAMNASALTPQELPAARGDLEQTVSLSKKAAKKAVKKAKKKAAKKAAKAAKKAVGIKDSKAFEEKDSPKERKLPTATQDPALTDDFEKKLTEHDERSPTVSVPVFREETVVHSRSESMPTITMPSASAQRTNDTMSIEVARATVPSHTYPPPFSLPVPFTTQTQLEQSSLSPDSIPHQVFTQDSLAQTMPPHLGLASPPPKVNSLSSERAMTTREKRNVLSRTRQFGLMAPSALLNLVEALAVVWRQSTEERLTAKELFIRGALLSVELHLQELHEYDVPQEQLQRMEEQLAILKKALDA